MSYPFGSPHPAGECKQPQQITENSRFPIDTYAGRLHVEWDPQSAVTPLGQLPFFIEFLKTTKLFDELVEECPLELTSNSASNVRDILGSILESKKEAVIYGATQATLALQTELLDSGHVDAAIHISKILSRSGLPLLLPSITAPAQLGYARNRMFPSIELIPEDRMTETKEEQKDSQNGKQKMASLSEP